MTAKPTAADRESGKLTTHVLDTANGRPGAGMAISLFRLDSTRREKLVDAVTNGDGRCDGPLLEGQRFSAGTYELEFEVGEYFRAQDNDPGSTDLRFLDTVLVRFGIASAAEHYHVPLLVSPFAYSTYRGS